MIAIPKYNVSLPVYKISLNYHLLCNQRHCIQHWSGEWQNDVGAKEAVKAWKCNLWLCISFCSRKSFICAGSVWCKVSQDLGSSHPLRGSTARGQRCSLQNPALSDLAMVHLHLCSVSTSVCLHISENIDYWVLQNFSSSLSKSCVLYETDKGPELWNWILLHQEEDESILRGLWLTGMELFLLHFNLYMNRVAKQMITVWAEGHTFDSQKWLELLMFSHASALYLQSSPEVVSSVNKSYEE